jgi:hypothetical protein
MCWGRGLARREFCHQRIEAVGLFGRGPPSSARGSRKRSASWLIGDGFDNSRGAYQPFANFGQCLLLVSPPIRTGTRAFVVGLWTITESVPGIVLFLQPSAGDQHGGALDLPAPEPSQGFICFP